ncbi:hypothetical protein Taro_029661, partial [Colocasia esculenta]|nr:hypothetical protein [Colocasia esculenta]
FSLLRLSLREQHPLALAYSPASVFTIRFDLPSRKSPLRPLPPSAIQTFLMFYLNFPSFLMNFPFFALPYANNLREQPPPRPRILPGLRLHHTLRLIQQEEPPPPASAGVPASQLLRHIRFVPQHVPRRAHHRPGGGDQQHQEQRTPLIPHRRAHSYYREAPRTTATTSRHREEALLIKTLPDWKSQLNLPRARIIELAAFPSQPHSRHFQRGTQRLEDWKSQLNLPRTRIVELAAFPSQPHSRLFQRVN